MPARALDSTCRPSRRALALLVLAPALAGAAPSLYDRMGGEPVVSAVCDELVDAAASGHATARSFEGAKLERIKHLLAEQICELAGGPCTYSGDPMREVHAGHQISQREFFAMVQLLKTSLRQHGVALAERNELIGLLAPMAREIVEPPHAVAQARR